MSSFLVSITHSASGSLRILDAGERVHQLFVLAAVVAHFFLGERLDHFRIGHRLFELFQAIDRRADRLEIGEHPAEPAVVHIVHPAAFGFFLDDILGLLLGADEEHRAAGGGEVAREVERRAEHLHGLLQIDNVDAVAGAEDVLLHLRVPPAGLMAEVNAGLQKLLHADFSHRI